MSHDLPALSVLGVFDDPVSAEIACALLSEASIRSDEPEAAESRSWRVWVRSVKPDLAARAEVILRSARARATTITGDDEQTAGSLGTPSAFVPEASRIP